MTDPVVEDQSSKSVVISRRSQSSKVVTLLTAPSIVSLTFVNRCDSNGLVELLISICSVDS